MSITENKGMFSSNTDMWATPKDFYDELNKEFGFQTDVCAIPDNAKCENYFTPDLDGLKQDWEGVCWMNPPYGRVIGQWVKKAFEESEKHGSVVVCLLPARTDTKWWHEYCMKGEIRLVKGRLKFGDSKNSAPFPSAVVIFGNHRRGELSAI
ncbi:DNA N-6-adenine-methyltransferase [Cytobacillus gottheilii]|uniref:DNA N-6-adenine-methyltransferase n=1 Tax=Cytobacillus gottheilii TaxID=859144 RepID=UPI0009B984F6|nr:DNA N-6-adenine-methyltransferase [Cytobacillus gottheilii]